MRFFLVAVIALTQFIGYSSTDFVRVMFNRNGCYEATIGWHQVKNGAAKLYYATNDFKPADYAKCDFQATVTAKNEFKGFSNRFVHLQNLNPNTAYYFVLVDEDGPSERYWFKTTPDGEDTRLSLIAGGDSRTRRPVRQKANKMVGKLKPHAVLFAGDYTDIDTPEKWRFWFNDWQETYKNTDNRIIPLVNVRGNHELTNKDLTAFFNCPNKRNYYSVKLGGNLLNVVCLNTEWIFGFNQKSFLKTTLMANSDMYWQIPIYHRACRPHVCWKMKMRGVKNIYRHWIALFEKFGVRFVIECDSHITKSTWPIVKSNGKEAEDGFVRDDDKGVVYAGEGCWGAPLRTVDCSRSWTREHGAVNSFKWIFVDKNELQMRTVEYMNVDSVQAVTEENRFTLPSAIKIWEKLDGNVLRIFRDRNTKVKSRTEPELEIE